MRPTQSALMGQRDADVAQAMADSQMDGASDEYAHVESRWQNASNEVRSVIDLVKTTLSENDQTACTTQGKTRTAITNIG